VGGEGGIEGRGQGKRKEVEGKERLEERGRGKKRGEAKGEGGRGKKGNKGKERKSGTFPLSGALGIHTSSSHRGDDCTLDRKNQGNTQRGKQGGAKKHLPRSKSYGPNLTMRGGGTRISTVTAWMWRGKPWLPGVGGGKNNRDRVAGWTSPGKS